MSNIFFVTGGEGLIGYHLCRYLLSKSDNSVISLDINKKFIDNPLHRFYIDYRKEILSKYPQYLPLRMDVSFPSTLDNLVTMTSKTHKLPDTIDCLFHLSSLPLANVSNKSPGSAFHNIYKATFHMLEFACPNNRVQNAHPGSLQVHPLFRYHFFRMPSAAHNVDFLTERLL